jgi:hypothetical protein
MREGNPIYKSIKDKLDALIDGDALTIRPLIVHISEEVSPPSNFALAAWWPVAGDTKLARQWKYEHDGTMTRDERVEWAKAIVDEIAAEEIVPAGWLIHGEPVWTYWNEEAARAHGRGEWFDALPPTEQAYYRSQLAMHASFRKAKNKGDTSS